MKPDKNKKLDKRGAGGKDASKGKKEEDKSPTFTCGSTKKKTPKGEEKLDDSTKEFYLLQIGGLEYQLERYQRLSDQLHIKLQNIKTSHDERDQEKLDIISHLDRTLRTKSEQLNVTGKELQELQLSSHIERQEFEAQTSQLNQTLEETKDRLNYEIDALKALLKSMEKYQLEKEEVESRMEAMLEEMEANRKAQQAQMSSFDRQRVFDVNRLRNDMNIRVTQLAAAFSADFERRLRQNTHSAIQENVDTGHLLTVHSKTTGILMKENDELKREMVVLKRKMETMRMVERDIVRRNCSLKEVLRLMRNRCVALDTAAKDCEQLKMDYASAMKTIVDLSEELKTTKDYQGALQNENTRLVSAVTLAEGQTLKVNRVNIQLRRLLSEAAFVIRRALETSTSEECAQSEYEISMKRNAVVHQLSVLFGSAAVLGVDNDLVEEAERKGEAEEEDEDEEEAGAEDEAKQPKCNVDAATMFRRVITAQRLLTEMYATQRQTARVYQFNQFSLFGNNSIVNDTNTATPGIETTVVAVGGHNNQVKIDNQKLKSLQAAVSVDQSTWRQLCTIL